MDAHPDRTRRSVVARLGLVSRRIFLVDALGALATFALITFLLRPHLAWFGMPDDVLLVLSLIAAVLAVFSSACFLLLTTNLRPFLLVVIVANVLYCGTTLVLVVLHRSELTPLGVAYFAAELVVMGALILAELKVLAALRS